MQQTASSRWQTIITPRLGAHLFLIGCLFAVYYRVLGATYLSYDDAFYLLGNPVLFGNSLDHWQALLTPGAIRNEGLYIPVFYASYLLEFNIWGAKPAVSHTINLLLHMACTAVLFEWLSRISGSRRMAFVAAVFFGLSPINVEAVSWAMGRKDLLAALFCLLAAWAAWSDGQRSSRWMQCVILATATLAVLSKPTALVLPVMLLAQAYFCRYLSRRVVVMTGVLLLINGVLFMANQYAASFVAGDLGAPPISFQLLSIPWALGQQTLVVFGLAPGQPFYPWADQDMAPAMTLFALSIIAITCILAYLAVRHRKSSPLFAYGLLWGVIALTPALKGLLDYHVHNTSSDRYFYIAMIGFSAACAVAVSHYWERAPKAVFACLVAYAVVIGTQSWRQTGIWKNTETIWLAALSHDPGNVVGWRILGKAYVSTDRHQDAAFAFVRATQVAPWDMRGHLHLGAALRTLGHSTAAEHAYGVATAHPNANAAVFVELGMMQGRCGGFDAAEASFGQAHRRQPGYSGLVGVMDRLADELHDSDDLQNAEKLYRRVLAQHPNAVVWRVRLLDQMVEQARPREAQQWLDDADAATPGLVNNSALNATRLRVAAAVRALDE
jgi:Tfp pilus assembly protein PilF